MNKIIFSIHAGKQVPEEPVARGTIRAGLPTTPPSRCFVKKRVPLLLCTLLLSVAGVQAQRVALFDRDRLPQPVFHSHPGLVELYWRAWEEAWEQAQKLSRGRQEETIRLQDIAFTALYCKYAPHLLPGIKTLDHFYFPVLEGTATPAGVERLDTPPILAWVEEEYDRFTGDGKRMEMLLQDKRFLQRYFNWFDSLTPATRLPFPHQPVTLEKKGDGYRRVDDSDQGDGLLRVDVISQQALSALCIARLAGLTGDKATAKEFRERYKALKTIVNTRYWNEETGTYHDLKARDLSPVKVKTLAACWAMLAEIPAPGQARRMIDLVQDTSAFEGSVPWLPARAGLEREEGVNRQDDAWGTVAYAGIKALERYDLLEEADELAYNLLIHLHATFTRLESHALRECYSPLPAGATHDTDGWPALCPISLFIENVLGFHRVDAREGIVEWRKYHRGLHGIKNLSFGEITADIIGDDHAIQVETNEPFTLIVNGKSHRVRKGSNTFR
ncbi:MAG: hypothetical protein LBP56_03175 [Odoribacteraceae bacterium]|jgi:hypothetical protein|nr:hypothetical protein [Odoribacteraceae bacterium]